MKVLFLGGNLAKNLAGCGRVDAYRGHEKNKNW